MKQVFFGFFSILLFNSTTSFAQTWDGSSINTTTSSGTPQVGIGTSTPAADLHIEHNATYNSTTPPGTGFGPVLKIDNTRDFLTGPPQSYPGTDYNLLEINNTDLFGGPGTQQTFFSVNTLGNVDILRNMSVNGSFNVNYGVFQDIFAYNTVNVGNANHINPTADKLVVRGNIQLDHETDGIRNIKAYTQNGGIGIFPATGISDGPGIELYGSNLGGNLVFSSLGNDAGVNSLFSANNPGTATSTPIMTLYNNGNAQIHNLNSGMVVSDASGVLSVQAIPADNQTLSINGNNLSISNGNTIALPGSTGDNMGNHTAQQNLNMNSKDIVSAAAITGTTITGTAFKFANTNTQLTASGGDISTGNGTTLAVNGPITGSEKFKVTGNANITGDLTVGGTIFGTLSGGSDKRFKKDIIVLEEGVTNRLKSLKPYQYNYIQNDAFPFKFDNKKHYGFIAQEVQKVFPELISPIGNNNYLTINYTEFIPMLLQAIVEEDEKISGQKTIIDQLQEKVNALNSEKENVAALQSKVTDLENQIISFKNTVDMVNEQQKTIAQLLEKIANIESDLNVCCLSNKNHHDIKKGAIKSTLDQNVPNPYNGDTKISFNIVEEYVTAFIGIYDLNGRQIKQIPIEHGVNHIIYSNKELQPGMYIYSLIVDSTLIDSKKMIASE